MNLIALDGHALAQTPQPAQSAGSIYAFSLPLYSSILIALYGQSGTQTPQLLHLSLSTSETIASNLILPGIIKAAVAAAAALD